MSTHTMEGHHRHRAPRQHTFLGSLFRRDRRTPAASDVPPEVAQPVQTAADESAHDRCTHPDPEDHAAIGQQIADGLMTIIQEAGRLAPDCTGGPLPDWTDKPGTGGVSVAGQVWEHGWPDGGPDTRPQPRAAYGDLFGPAPAPDGPAPDPRPAPRSVSFSAAAEPTVNLSRVDTGIGRPFSPDPGVDTEPSTWLRSLDPGHKIDGRDVELRGDPLFRRLAPGDDGGLLAELNLGESPARSYRLAAGSKTLRMLAAAALRGADKLDAADAEAAGTGSEETADGTAADTVDEPAGAPASAGPDADAAVDSAAGTADPPPEPAETGPDAAQLEQEIFADQEKLDEITRGGPVVEQPGGEQA